MPTRVLGGAFFGFDSWDGYPQEREDLLAHIRDQPDQGRRVRDRRHPHVHRRRRAHGRRATAIRRDRVRRRVDHLAGLGETDLPAGNGVIIKGNDKSPHTDPSLIDDAEGINPWVDQADFDHHGYGKVVATKDAFDCEMVRMQTIKKKTTAKISSAGLHYRVARGQQSIKGTAM